MILYTCDSGKRLLERGNNNAIVWDAAGASYGDNTLEVPAGELVFYAEGETDEGVMSSSYTINRPDKVKFTGKYKEE